MLSLTSSVSGCVFLPAIVSSRVGIHTVCVLLLLSSSEEGGDASAERDESVDLPPQSVLFEELLKVVTRAVAKLNIDWPAEKECQEHPKSKLDECFLRSKSPPPRRGLPFFPDLHTEVSRSWNKPYSVCLFSPHISHYSNVLGLNEWDNGKMPRVEETLVSFLLAVPRYYPPS